MHGTRYSTQVNAEADLFDYIEPLYAPKEVTWRDNRKWLHSTLSYDRRQSPWDASPESYLKNRISTQNEQLLAA